MATSADEAYAIAIYDPNNIFLGPKLTEIKDIIKKYEISDDISFQNITNLDGGFASIYKNEDVYLKEYSVVGGFLCFN